jgi:orotate phosphoribosyltransferase
VQAYQREFVDFLREAESLLIGEFRLKSGRISPLFLNAGLLDTGSRLIRVGRAYAATLLEQVGADGFDVVFGPAYKGIPLAVATVTALAEQGVEKPYLADRKEAKAHGAEASGGGAAKRLLGRPPAEDATFVMVDDVLTTGGTKDEAAALLKEIAPRGSCKALLILLDRQETTPDGADAVQGFTDRTGIPVLPVLKITEVLDDLAARGGLSEDDLARCRAYWGEYGTESARAWARRA